ncbi:DUF4288 domain-containing protein [Sporosarcina koreensis]|uniref:DUF4288 domain-containing protein n=1 Tax=Bacillales TaxID=1385 RepID=UPI0007576D62|nr:DUF4288 domain-containing protein [Sporosarcina koreensis]
MKLYSVKLLLESTVIPNEYSSKTFEETIVLLRASGQDGIETKIRGHFVDLTYENAVGGQTTWSFVTLLDVFEVVDHFDGDVDFKEVYSRFLPFDEPMTAGEVIEKYSLDK